MNDAVRGHLAAALREEREFVLALGGYALEIPGGTLVTNERVPVPAFNFVQELRVAPERQAAFFERALDHYFQRALRPSFRVSVPVPAHLDRTLRAFSFRARDNPLTYLLRARDLGAGEPDPEGFRIREAGPEELDEVSQFWAGEREGVEFRRALTVVTSHPNPGERLRPFLALAGDRTVAAALVYSSGGSTGIHAVATQPAERGRGGATALVAHIVAGDPGDVGEPFSMISESSRLEPRLVRLGFHPAGRWTVYELPLDAELSLPPAGPAQPPRWRPPKKRSSG